MIVEVTLVFLLILWFVYKYCTSNYTYWKDRSVPYVEPHFPFGSEKDFILHKTSFGEHYQNQYNKFKNAKMIGAITANKPFLIIKDPELIKLVLVKDFNHFVDRGLFDPDLLSPVAKNLFMIEGETWRNMRTKLTPTFTSGKMKMMYHLMETCVEELRIALLPVAEQNENLDVKDFVARFTTDVIASCAFGLEAHSIRNPESEIRQQLLKGFRKPSLLQAVQFLFGFLLPRLYKYLRLPLVSNPADEFFKKIIRDTVEYRDKNIRNDFIDLLMKIKNNKCLSDDDTSVIRNGINANAGITEEGLTLDEMTAQALVFLSAGFETASSTLTFCLYELSLNPDIQERLHKEVNDVLQKHSGKFSYQALKEIPYLDAVINETKRAISRSSDCLWSLVGLHLEYVDIPFACGENREWISKHYFSDEAAAIVQYITKTMRRYASLGFLNRKCTEDYKFPDTKFVVPKGMNLIIPVYAIHHDPEYYPDPYKFDPERFLNDTIKTKNNFTFLPFGEGPRMCIANRFGMLQVKICLSMMINSYQFSVTEATTKPPVEIDKHVMIATPKTPIILKISKRVDK